MRSTQAVNVREQPDLKSAVIVTLRNGRVVAVDKVLGQWVLITLDSGRKGYIKAAFLNIEPDRPVATAAPAVSSKATAVHTAIPSATPPFTASPMPTETPAITPVGTAAVSSASAERPTPEAQHDSLQHEIGRLRDRLTALESLVSTPDARSGAQTGTPARVPVHEREGLRPGGGLSGGSASMEPEDIGPSMALAGVGLVVGFLLGAAYGRRQERSRRSRVRF